MGGTSKSNLVVNPRSLKSNSASFMLIKSITPLASLRLRVYPQAHAAFPKIHVAKKKAKDSTKKPSNESTRTSLKLSFPKLSWNFSIISQILGKHPKKHMFSRKNHGKSRRRLFLCLPKVQQLRKVGLLGVRPGVFVPGPSNSPAPCIVLFSYLQALPE